MAESSQPLPYPKAIFSSVWLPAHPFCSINTEHPPTHWSSASADSILLMPLEFLPFPSRTLLFFLQGCHQTQCLPESVPSGATAVPCTDFYCSPPTLSYTQGQDHTLRGCVRVDLRRACLQSQALSTVLGTHTQLCLSAHQSQHRRGGDAKNVRTKTPSC